jgi:hypothetical protein
MLAAGEEMPSLVDAGRVYEEAPGGHLRGMAAVLDIFAPLLARRTQERDEARLAARRWADDVRTLNERNNVQKGRLAEVFSRLTEEQATRLKEGEEREAQEGAWHEATGCAGPDDAHAEMGRLRSSFAVLEGERNAAIRRAEDAEFLAKRGGEDLAVLRREVEDHAKRESKATSDANSARAEAEVLRERIAKLETESATAEAGARKGAVLATMLSTYGLPDEPKAFARRIEAEREERQDLQKRLAAATADNEQILKEHDDTAQVLGRGATTRGLIVAAREMRTELETLRLRVRGLEVLLDELLAVDERGVLGDLATRDRAFVELGDVIVKARAALSGKVDEQPIADPAERAKAVAKELRRRGLFAAVLGGGIAFSADRKAFWYHMAFEGVAATGPRAIADRIQQEEAARAEAWAVER